MEIIKRLEELKEKNTNLLESKFSFDYYLETKFNQNTEGVIKSFLELIENTSDKELIVIKTNDGKIISYEAMRIDKIIDNWKLTETHTGIFSDEDIEVSFALMNADSSFFTYFNEGMLMFSAKKEIVDKLAEIFDKYNIKYHEPYCLS